MTMKNVQIHTLGFPRIGAQRELKFALEAHWRGELDEAGLVETGRSLRARHWNLQVQAGLSHVTVGDFAYYDQMLNHIELFGCAPVRFKHDSHASPLARQFAMARGVDADEHAHCCGAQGAHALDMTKWFDTNYHYLVPELDADSSFTLTGTRLFDEVAEAQTLGHPVKVALIGPLTFLWQSRANNGTDRLELLVRLLPVYAQVLQRLKLQGVEWVQIDEPILGLDLPSAWRNAFEPAYWLLSQSGIKLMLATYFSPLEENLSLACRLPVAGLHVDGVRAPQELIGACDWLALPKVLSIGIVDGRNIWRSNLDQALATLRPLLDKRDTLWLAPSCSLLHVPLSLDGETALDAEVRSWMAFATEKLAELATLRRALNGEADTSALALARAAIHSRAASVRVHQDGVGKRVRDLPADADRRSASYAERQLLQGARLGLPAFPTTTIGSFRLQTGHAQPGRL